MVVSPCDSARRAAESVLAGVIKAAPAAPLARHQRRAQPPKARAVHAEPQLRDS